MNTIIWDEDTHITKEQMVEIFKYYEKFFYTYYMNEQIEEIVEDIIVSNGRKEGIE